VRREGSTTITEVRDGVACGMPHTSSSKMLPGPTGRLLKNDAWSFSYTEERWYSHPDMPSVGAGRAYAAAAAVSQNIVLYGGQCVVSEEAARGTPCTDHLWQFDYLRGVWQGLTLAPFKAQLEDLREHISPVRAQLEHLQATSTG